MLAKQTRGKVRIAIDVEAYRARHNEALALLAQKYGEKVKRSGRSMTLNPTVNNVVPSNVQISLANSTPAAIVASQARCHSGEVFSGRARIEVPS